MAKVRVPRKHVTADEAAAVLSRRLGSEYKIEHNGDQRLMIRKNPLLFAQVAIRDEPGATVFRVQPGGFVILWIANSLTTARKVADALRRSEEFRSI